jgi:hypothetical protein
VHTDGEPTFNSLPDVGNVNGGSHIGKNIMSYLSIAQVF